MILRRRADSSARAPLAADAIRGDLLHSRETGLWTWTQLAPQRWGYSTEGVRRSLLAAQAQRWAGLAGRSVHLRVTNHPVPYTAWARQLDADSPRRLPDVAGAESWEDYLVAGQEAIRRNAGATLATYLGVRIGGRMSDPHRALRLILDDGDASEQVRDIRTARREVLNTVGKRGFGGRPVTSRGLGWLMHASTGLGCPVDSRVLAGDPAQGWAPDDMGTFTAPVRVEGEPYGGVLRVSAFREGAIHTRSVVVLPVADLGPRGWDDLHPSLLPWITESLSLPFPVEWSMQLDVLAGKSLRREAELRQSRAQEMADQHRTHGLRPDPETARAIADSDAYADEVSHAQDPTVSTRARGTVQVAVWGGPAREDAPDPDAEALRHAGELIDLYGGAPQIRVEHTMGGQLDALRSFTPGERRVAGWERQPNMRMMAWAVPNVAAGAGTPVGPYLGFTVGRFGKRAVKFDPTWGPAHNHSGVILVGGAMGGGKTTVAGMVVESAARRGWRCVFLDPPGQTRRLASLPYLRDRSRVLELGDADPGTLNPYILVPEPRARDHDEASLEAAVLEAAAERIDLVSDTFVGLLPSSMEHNPAVVAAVESACVAAGGHYGTSPWIPVRLLEERYGDAGREVAGMLRAAASMKGGRLVFPADEHADTTPAPDALEDVLTIVTMAHLDLPPRGVAPRNRRERISRPMIDLATRYCSRVMYADREPKVIVADELGVAGASSFGTWLTRASVDTRRQNTALLQLWQNPDQLLAVAPQIANLAGASMLFRFRNVEVAAQALRIAGIPEGMGYEHALTDLPEGDCLLTGFDRVTERVRVDRDYRAHVAQVLHTTPPSTERASDDLGMTA